MKRFNIVFLFVALLIYLSPLFDYQSNIAGAVPGDPYAHAGQLLWYCEALTTGTYMNTNYFAPMGVDMRTSYDMPLLNLLVCPFASLGPFFMFNMITVMQIILIVSASYLMIRNELNTPLLRILFVMLFTFSTYYMARASHHINLLSTLWALPLVFWSGSRLSFDRLERMLLFGLILGVSFVSAWQNIPNLVLLAVGLYCYRWWHSNRKNVRIFVLNGLVIIFSAAIVALPLMQPIMTGYIASEQVVDTKALRMFNADLLSYIIPWRGHALFPLFDRLYTAIATSWRQTYYEQFVGFDLLTLGLAGLSFVGLAKRRVRLTSYEMLLLVIGFVYLILSFGPYLSIGGEKLLELPYFVRLAQLPLFSISRTPARYGLVTVMVVMVVVFKLFERLYMHRKRPGLLIWLAVFGFFYVTVLQQNITFPVTNYAQRLPMKALKQMAKDERKMAVWHIPTGIQSDPSQNIMQALHGHPAGSAYVSYSVMSQDLLEQLRSKKIPELWECMPTSLRPEPYSISPLNDEAWVLEQLRHHKVRYVIVNMHLMGFKQCIELSGWVNTQWEHFEGVELIDYSGSYRVYIVN